MKFLKFIPICALLLAVGNQAFAQANTSLSNLSGVSINASLGLSADRTYDLGSTTDAANNVYAWNVIGGAGNMFVEAQSPVSSGNGWGLTLNAGSTTDSSPSTYGGNVTLTAGSATSGTGGGSVLIYAGQGPTRSADGVIQIMGHTQLEPISSPPTATTCGTSPSVVGSDNAARVTVGTGTFSSCTITFEHAWANTPTCTANSEKTAAALKVVPSTTSLTITQGSNYGAGTVLDFICIGWQ